MSYITIDKVKELAPFAHLAITTKEVNSKDIQDLRRVFTINNFNLDNLTSNIQIHSDIVHSVNTETVGMKREGDALVTNLKNVPLLVFTADCVPVALIDGKNKVIGVAHAGWRGTYEEIAKKTVLKMKEEHGSNPEDIIAVIGPSIGECCYQVSEDLYNKFKDRFNTTNYELYSIKEDSFYLNLQNINKYSLKFCGVKDENIINTAICTSCNNDKFHSYRMHNKTDKRIGLLLEIRN